MESEQPKEAWGVQPRKPHRYKVLLSTVAYFDCEVETTDPWAVEAKAKALAAQALDKIKNQMGGLSVSRVGFLMDYKERIPDNDNNATE